MWELPYTLKQLWQALSHEWVFDVGEVGAGKSFGVVQVLTFSMFFGSGFIVSSVVNKVLLDKLFDVFRVDPGAQNTFFLIIKYLTIIFFTMMGLMAVNLSSYISASLAMLGIAVSLGAKDQISDIFSGLLILLERQIEIGHFIKTGTTLGTVHIISLRSTTIRTARNFFVSIPNRLMISQSIENWGAGRVAVGMVMKIRVAYGSDPELVKNLISDALNNHPLVLRVPAAVLRLDDLADSGLEFFVRFFITARKAREVWNVASDIRIALLSSFKEHNIEVPFPQHVVHFAGAKKDEGGGNFNIKIDGVAPSDSNQM